jgi:predicted DCC family thiol-disulfide oxidoreductase YuxK
MQHGPLFSTSDGVKFDSCFYVNALDYHWHSLEKAEYRPRAEYLSPPEAEWGVDPTRVVMFYDGACPICSREVTMYRRLAASHPSSKLLFHDVSVEPEEGGVLWDAYGVPTTAALARIYVADRGVLRSGVSAFVSVWRELPYFRFLSMLFKFPGAVRTADVLYGVWARTRHRLTGVGAPAPAGGGPGASCRVGDGSNPGQPPRGPC